MPDMSYDAYQRSIDYLRISITDRCNLRCIYCMPEEGVAACSHAEVLRYEEIERVVRAAAALGIRKLRLTGGEPLVRLGVVDLVRMLADIDGIEDIAMTTNGMLLGRYAAPLAAAGLHRVNVSLDSLRPDRFRDITRRGDLDTVLAGIEAAFAAGLEPVKINTVVMRGRNDDEIVDLARKTLTEPWHVRFIEWMPVGEVAQGRDWRADVVTMAEVRARIEDALGRLLPASVSGAGPARVCRVPEAVGTLGFIGAVSEHFCASCNRLRLTADGKLRPCLLAPEELDLRAVLRGGGTQAEIQAVLLAAIRAKPRGHRLGDDGDGPATSQQHPRTMAQIGG